MRVLVTGATGFTGTHLVRRLLSRGHDVTMLDIQRNASAAELETAGARLVVGSVTDSELVGQTVPGHEVVFHLAAAFRQISESASFYRQVNIEGTRNVLTASERHAVKKVIHCSTSGVHGGDKRRLPWNEDSPIFPEDLYQQTKWGGEQVCQEFMKRGLDITIVRPTSEYGPGDVHGMRSLFRIVKSGRFLMFGSGLGTVHPIYIDNLIDLFELAAGNPRSGGRAYLAGDDHPCTLNDLVKAVGRAQGINVKIVHVPLLGPLYAASAMVEFACRPFKINPPIFRRRVAWFKANRAYSIERAKTELGYVPAVGLEEGLRRTTAWYRQQGFI
jgi:nucleoside-diphosphate-sugar epimerase